MGTNAHTKILCTQAPIQVPKIARWQTHRLSRTKKRRCYKTTVTKTAVAHHVSQKTTVTPRVTKDDGHTTCHKRRRNTPRVTKTTVHTTCHKDDGSHHVSQRQRLYTNVTEDNGYKPYVTKDSGYKPYVTNAAKNHMSTTVVKPYVTKDAAKPICQRRWPQPTCQTKFGAITPNGAKCKLLINLHYIFTT